MGPMELVTLKNINKVYKTKTSIQTHALHDINLAIQEREFVVLAGPSGSGKTTLLNIIGTLDRPTSGEVYIRGVEVTRLSRNDTANLRLREIGFVFQDYSLINVLTALENVEYVMLLQGVNSYTRRKKSEEILKAVGLGDLIHRRPYQMSGGQQQRVAVARAIAAEPHIILADEPTANLDSNTGESLIDLMKSFNVSEGITFIISSHDPMVIQRAGRLIRLKDGRVQED